MDPEIALLSITIIVAIKGIAALVAMFGTIHAAHRFKKLNRSQKVHYFLAVPLSVIALLWVAAITILLTHMDMAHQLPHMAWYFFIFASPAAAIAAGNMSGLFATKGMVSPV